MIVDKDIALILELFDSCHGAVEGRKRLQKLVYILKKEGQIPFSFSFRPYFYGPYSEDLTDLIETMVSSQFVREEKRELWPGVVQYDYKLTEKGVNMLSKLRRLPSLVANLDDMRRKCESLNSVETKDLVVMSKQLMGMLPVPAT
jgi:uncharacterized protein YwgA